jgi:hypothetical protein
VKCFTTLPFLIVAYPEALIISPSTPPDKETSASHPTLASSPKVNLPFK